MKILIHNQTETAGFTKLSSVIYLNPSENQNMHNSKLALRYLQIKLGTDCVFEKLVLCYFELKI